MAYQRILTIQDISCVGQCSLTVALPILSACGMETAVLPSAVLSTHTGGFQGYTFRDLTEDMPAIRDHWQRERICFDAVYTGYLGNARQMEIVETIAAACGKPGAVLFVDPAMADNGVLYPGFDEAYVAAMRALCQKADYILPNLTEACLLAGRPYLTQYEAEDIEQLLQATAASEEQTVILTGVSRTEGTTGVAIYHNGRTTYYQHPKLPVSCHGTGDVYASTFVGARLRGFSAERAAALAADFTVRCIENTVSDPTHWYGVKFEPLLGSLIEELTKQ